jgi:hypothetical protein
MRKLRVLVAIVAALFALALSANVASATPDVSRLCTGSGEFGFRNHGQCVSTFETIMNNGEADPVAVCRVFENGGFSNQGLCVRYLRSQGF